MEIYLSSKEREKLITLHRKERDKRVCDRIKAVLAYDDGYRYSEIAKILLLDDETIRRHVKDYFDEAKLRPKNGGSDSGLDDYESKKLIEHLEEFTYLHIKNICTYVKLTFGKGYSVSGMTKWLHRNNFCYKKPHPVPAKANSEAQKVFVRKYKRLSKSPENKGLIYFSDSVHPQHQTRLAYGWILKGARKDIATTARQKRLNFIGGICLEGHKIIQHEVEKVNAESIKCFLKLLRKRHYENERIHLIWDNAAYHKSKEVKAFAKALNIKLHYLPPYSPNLNPIERLWKIMHEEVTYNKYYEKFSDFREATFGFFRNIGKRKTVLRSRLTDNFQIINAPMFAS